MQDDVFALGAILRGKQLVVVGDETNAAHAFLRFPRRRQR